MPGPTKARSVGAGVCYALAWVATGLSLGIVYLLYTIPLHSLFGSGAGTLAAAIGLFVGSGVLGDRGCFGLGPTSVSLLMCVTLVGLTAALAGWGGAVYHSRFALDIRPVDSVRLGFVSPRSARVLATAAGYGRRVPEVTLVVRDGGEDPVLRTTIRLDAPAGVGALHIGGLRERQEYTYTAMFSYEDTGTNTVLGRFVTPTAAAEDFSFMAGSCWFPNPARARSGEHAWREIAAGAPDFFLFLGDIMYADFAALGTADMDRFSATFRGFHAHPDVTESARHVPTLYMLDDHELRENYRAGQDTALYARATHAYERFFHVTNPDAATENAFYYTFVWKAVPVFVLDTRSYLRVGETILGDTQRAALEAWLRTTSAAWLRVIASPTAVALDGDESWGYAAAHERAQVVALCEELGLLTLFVSGDVHFPFVAQLGPGVVELGSSPILGPSGAVRANDRRNVLWYLPLEPLFTSQEAILAQVSINHTTQCVQLGVDRGLGPRRATIQTHRFCKA